ncbi:ABC transporter permease [Thalassotalea eurytherma]|uniref:Multidrug ABC transporter substrate-binding protein n=1 Tax=Thalassotalea eurytherma TaxID=1144278 RepID=A0ABQ6H0E6_9GAMM|nr:ABC transporter permease [Thalassotalea eurytherma]GLX81671.1 multidrug ABC transporter substrate-binding protein [Thalassotalea eurytherma]
MKTAELFIDAIAQLMQHKLRTLLTLLGMIFGVGAVIAMLNIGEGAENEALKMISTMGLHNLIVESKSFEEQELKEQRKHSAGLTLRDAEIVNVSLPFVEQVAALKKLETYTIFSAFEHSDTDALGVTASYFSLSNLSVTHGRLLDNNDIENYHQVAVLGNHVASQLFPLSDPVGQNIKINHLWFKVVGVIALPHLKKEEFQGVKLGGEQDNVFIPLSTAQRKFAQKRLSSELSQIKFKLNENVDAVQASEVISQLLTKRHNNIDDFTLTVPAQLLAQQKQTQRIFNIIMSCVAGISLLVGGIGIMNIMLATVLERTKEIGLLRAVGATQQNIQRQFIAESFTISILGGIIGVVFGIALSELIALYSNWAVTWSLGAIVLSFSICAVVGLVFGVYPAIKASKLDPITALQTD